MKRHALADGFSLLEVMVTLFLLTILMGLVIPHLNTGKLESMRSAANRFRNVLIWLRDQGSFGLAEYRLRMDLTQGSYFCEVRQEESFVPVKDPLLLPGVLHPSLGKMIWQAEKNDLPDLSEIIIRFTSFGPEKAIMVQFAASVPPGVAEEAIGFTVSFRPEWSKPRLEQGLRTWE
ncbi:MAG: prepilin-type N-terminal cleavage/methylation domain-containing protein [Magnetococcales bacterium]|nr:prepilin-type N-terminal cleavage/methylation domain-containing protein [Magnetococcales bacterium]